MKNFLLLALVAAIHLRDDDEPAPKKTDELDAIMNRYDEEEKHEAYLKSPQYKLDQKKEADEKLALE